MLSQEINGESSLTYASEEGGTRVTWRGGGNAIPIVGFLIVGSIESGVGEYYQQALRGLKHAVESGGEAGEAAAAAPDAGTATPPSADGGAKSEP